MNYTSTSIATAIAGVIALGSGSDDHLGPSHRRCREQVFERRSDHGLASR